MLHNDFSLIIFDADKTLRRTKNSPGRPPNTADEQVLINKAVQTIKKINWSNRVLGIASNQAGVGAGYISKRQAHFLLEQMVRIISKAVDVNDTYIQFCPHKVDQKCRCRKPNPGMLHSLMRNTDIDPSHTLYIGDKECDRIAAKRARCSFLWANHFHNANFNKIKSMR